MDNAFKKQLKTVGHKLKPIVTVADKGITENISAEIERALNDHELIKLRLSIPDRDARTATANQICAAHGATLVQKVGNVVLIFRAADKPNPKLSNLLRVL